MKEKGCLISVIVPVYNAHLYLDKCITSILSQTYKNIELLLVDDGSTDESYLICKKYEQIDCRVHAYTKENGGQASARNYALKLAQGDYFSFVDNDDWCEPEMFETLMNLAVQYNADIIGGKEFTNDVPIKSNDYKVYSMKEYASLLLPDEIGSHVLAQLFKRNLFNDIEFPYSKTVEDMRLFTKLIERCTTVVKTNSEVYHYTIHENNTSFRYAQTPASSLDRAQAFSERYYITKKLCPNKLDIIIKKSVSFGLGGIRLISNDNITLYKEELAELKKFYRLHVKEIICSREIDIVRKIATLIYVTLGERIFVLANRLCRSNHSTK